MENKWELSERNGGDLRKKAMQKSKENNNELKRELKGRKKRGKKQKNERIDRKDWKIEKLDCNKRSKCNDLNSSELVQE